jgi:hypothetical protein
MGLHNALTGADIHVIHTYTYANQTARLAATGFVSADIGKVAYQTDNSTVWVLVGYSPILWSELTVPATNIFGSNASNQEALSDTSTTSSTPQDKVTLTSGAVTGVHRIAFSAELYQEPNNKTVGVRLYNSTDAVVLCDVTHRDPIQLVWYGVSGFAYVTFAGVAKTFKVQFYSPDNSSAIHIRNARLEFWRVS